jgi:hypothetical protein
VIFAAGRAKFGTIGAALVETIGIVRLAVCAAWAGCCPPEATITSTGNATNSAASAGPRCLADHQFQVLGKKVAFVDQALSVLPHLFEIPRFARVAFLDRPAGIALRRAFFARPRERDRRPH